MDDDKIYQRGGTDYDVEQYAKQNGADLVNEREDVLSALLILSLFSNIVISLMYFYYL